MYKKATEDVEIAENIKEYKEKKLNYMYLFFCDF